MWDHSLEDPRRILLLSRGVGKILGAEISLGYVDVSTGPQCGGEQAGEPLDEAAAST